jgi:hypothetical protein
MYQPIIGLYDIQSAMPRTPSEKHGNALGIRGIHI